MYSLCPAFRNLIFSLYFACSKFCLNKNFWQNFPSKKEKEVGKEEAEKRVHFIRITFSVDQKTEIEWSYQLYLIVSLVGKNRFANDWEIFKQRIEKRYKFASNKIWTFHLVHVCCLFVRFQINIWLDSREFRKACSIIIASVLTLRTSIENNVNWPKQVFVYLKTQFRAIFFSLPLPKHTVCFGKELFVKNII